MDSRIPFDGDHDSSAALWIDHGIHSIVKPFLISVMVVDFIPLSLFLSMNADQHGRQWQNFKGDPAIPMTAHSSHRNRLNDLGP
jgi:hypothetical protein